MRAAGLTNLREGNAVRNIRIFFAKRGRAKYISHLDMTRLFTRAVRRTGITMWYTEGFHPHLYMTFALPLSLGIESDCESVDMKLVDDITLEGVKERLNYVMPEGIVVTNVCEPIMKANQIASSRYKVVLSAKYKDELLEFLSKDEINAIKKGKAGEKLVNIKTLIYDYSVKDAGKEIELTLDLASGNTKTLNPTLLLSVFANEQNIDLDGTFILRTDVLTENNEIFK